MKVGTKSVLFGAHCWLLHPWFVFAAWRKLYGFPWDPRLWLCFFVHDLGYIGKPNMDGPEGESHVEWGAGFMHLFDWRCIADRIARRIAYTYPVIEPDGTVCRKEYRRFGWEWHDLCLYHSRFYAKKDGMPFSKLCVADKLAIVLTPAWLYLPMARLSGEIKEYMSLAEARTAQNEPKYSSMGLSTSSEQQWYQDVQAYLYEWVVEHKDGREDTWTPKAK